MWVHNYREDVLLTVVFWGYGAFPGNDGFHKEVAQEKDEEVKDEQVELPEDVELE